MHDEPAFVALGFKPNRRGGWWFPRAQQRLHPPDRAVKGRTPVAGVLALLALVAWSGERKPTQRRRHAAFQAFRVVDDIAQA